MEPCAHGKAARHLCQWCLAYDHISPEYHWLIDDARAHAPTEAGHRYGPPDQDPDDDDDA